MNQLVTFLLLACTASAGSTKPRHVVFINMDDLGYGDASCYGATALQTPNMDALAAAGIRFTDAHSASSFCSPSRYSLITGRHSLRSSHPRLQKGIFLPGGAACAIGKGRFTLAAIFKEAGYSTALIGKWHLGDGVKDGSGKYSDPEYRIDPGPLDFGFDYFFGHITDRHLPPLFLAENRHFVLDENGKRVDTNTAETLDATSRMFAENAVAWLEEHAQKNMFLYLNPNVSHLPFTPSKPFIGSSKAGYYGDYVQEGDWIVGQIVQALKRLQVLDQTLLIVTSDNGGAPISYAAGCSFRRWPDYFGQQGIAEEEFPWGENHEVCGVLSGHKGSVREGGHRVPLIVHWPEVINEPKVSDALFYQMDFMATFAALLDVTIPEGQAEDSINVLDNLLGTMDEPIRESFTMFAKDGKAIRQGDWKLHLKTDKKKRDKAPIVNLYNLKEDISESNDLANEHPEMVAALREELERRFAEMQK